MILKTKEFQEAANKILFAAGLDQSAANLELFVNETYLYLNVTNKEYYVSVKFAIENPEDFRAVVDASLFLNLIAGISTDTFELVIDGNAIKVKSGKSNYKLPMIFENSELMVLPVIKLGNKTVEMDVENDILQSILTVNSKEVQKGKKLDVKEIMKLYYIDETGCFTFTTGSCLNRFTLEKPIKLLLNDRIVKLFKLFTEDKVHLSFGYDPEAGGVSRPKAIFQAANVYVAARINCDDALIHKIQGPCEATKNFVNEAYANNIVVSTAALAEAISRISLFAKFNKNTPNKVNMSSIIATVTASPDELTIVDDQTNVEVVPIDNSSVVDTTYVLKVNLSDIKMVLDSCKQDHLTMNYGNKRSVVLNRGPISNLIPEYHD